MMKHHEKSIVLGPRLKIKKNVFSQWTFNNTDFNINTLDGKNTLHSMGCLQSLYPEDCFEKIESIPRLTSTSKSEEIAKLDKIGIYTYYNVNPLNYQKLVAKKSNIKDVNN